MVNELLYNFKVKRFYLTLKITINSDASMLTRRVWRASLESITTTKKPIGIALSSPNNELIGYRNMDSVSKGTIESVKDIKL